jgi:pyruvate/2-oxoglutarate dehydrogenase complex dihydrolipoamide dehydrogenase (E3) component
MATVQLVMKAGLPYTILKDMVIAHPTLSEGISFMFNTVK